MFYKSEFDLKPPENKELPNKNYNREKNESSKKILNVKETFLEWSKSVDINCYTKMIDYRGNYFIQFIWLLILFGSTGGTFYLISKSLIDYLKYEVTSQIEIIDEAPAKFPAITFCDSNPFSSIKAQEFMQNISLLYNITNESTYSNRKLIYNLARIQASSKKFDFNDRILFKPPIEIWCEFKSKNCIDGLNWYWSYEYGNCFQFNSGFNVSNQSIDFVDVAREGKDFGVTLGWFPLVNLNNFLSTGARGLVVFVHNNTFKPNEEVFIEAGKMSYISVKRKKTKKYPSPYSDCIDLNTYKSDLFEYIKKSNKTYRRKDCVELCIQRQIIEKCSCYFTGYDDMKTDSRPCLSLEDLSCLEENFSNFNLETCQTNSCPLECDSISYDLTLSSLEYPDEFIFEKVFNNQYMKNWYLEKFNLNMSYNLVKSNYASVTVYYPSLQYEQISESPKTQIIDLFTQIGGALGMFVSFSIFTIFELIEIFLLILKGLISKP